MLEPAALRDLRARASRFFIVVLWAHVPIVTLIAATSGNDALLPTLGAVGLAAIGSAGAWFAPAELSGRLAVAWALIGMPMLFVHAAAGALQIDFHMYFFAVFAMLAAYVDWRPIALAATLVALHHLVLDFAAPRSVFPTLGGIDGLPRVLLHAAIVVAECGVLFWITARVYALFVDADAKHQRAEQALDEAAVLREMLTGEAALKDAALGKSQLSLTEARDAAASASHQESLRILAERELAQSRSSAIREVAQRLDAEVATAVDEVGRASHDILVSARDAERLAGETTREVTDVAHIADRVGATIAQTAGATDQLSHSIASITQRMREAVDAGERTARESERGTESARALRDAAERIEAVTTLIETVADQSRLLALNAAIEAARAGDAGRGFGVVADEVRKLAETTSDATKEIGDTVRAMRRASANVSTALEDIRRAVGDLTVSASDVASSVEQQSAATQTIAAAVREAADGTNAIRTAVSRVAAATAHAGVAAGILTAGAEHVGRQNDALRSGVGDLTSELRSTGSADATALALAR